MTSTHDADTARTGSRTHRRAALALLAGLAIAGTSPVQAQGAFPNKPIRVVVPTPAGTSPDVIARLWGEQMSRLLGQPVLIDNKPGGSSIIGVQAVLSAPADGYTLLYSLNNTTSINPFIFKTLPYKTEDFAPVAHILSVPFVMVVSGNSQVKSVQDLVQAGVSSFSVQ